MSTRSSDFNYKVALASGLKSLQLGRLRQAEEQFRYLLERFPSADGCYRGLAKVLIEQEDRPAALRMLLDGGAAVAKSGQRAAAIGLYRDATALDANDLAAHRRLAAALTLAGEPGTAAAEYVRHSGYPGGMRTESLERLLARRPEEVIRRAVRGMVPQNRLGEQMMRKLHVYAGAEHPHAAQRPTELKEATAR